MTFILEVIGTIAFAFAGALVAIDNDLDLFGVVCMAVSTACGGGMTRDIILGNTPPMAFRNPIYVSIAVVVAFLTVLIYHSLAESRFRDKIMDIVNILDALGLAIFTIVGMDLAVQLGYDGAFLLCFVGVITAVGGGLLRDIMVNVKPVILTKEIYATASMAGAIFYYAAIKGHTSYIAGASVTFFIIFGLRMWTIIKHINLPVVDRNKNQNQ